MLLIQTQETQFSSLAPSMKFDNPNSGLFFRQHGQIFARVAPFLREQTTLASHFAIALYLKPPEMFMKKAIDAFSNTKIRVIE